ncbi:hypothetical protein [uncultured Brachyspira sp.]|uniref:hypothetical protein n=1 Tax=uncultured Brachyspira sp. TaxID=221953 RepID=UPI0025FFAE68|nr:hypothetical protein [uncultured Brachyspira sp.]
MIILSHRGLWQSAKEKNTKKAFIESFNLGIGTETDLRDSLGQIVISHDMPKGGEITFEDVLQIMDGRNLLLALNIKADGISDEIKKLLNKYNHTNYFTFDMSIPDLVYQIKQEMKIFTGLSDILTKPVLIDKCDGIWLDCFYSDWYNASLIDEYINNNKKVCIVSSDLHQRCTKNQWDIIKKSKNINSDKLILCTDKPKDAINFFN